MKRKCLQCSNKFDIPTAPSRRERKKFCCKGCANLGNARLSAAKRGDAQRGRGEGKSYTKRNGRHEHRVVMEEKLGRSLNSHEIVHHVDGNKKNNHPDNLIVTNRSKHAVHHNTKYNPFCSVDNCNGVHYQKGFCQRHFWQMRRHNKIIKK